MTQSTEQERAEFLDQVGHLIADGTIETRSLKRAGISFACGNLHAAFLVWQAARRAPVVPQGWQELDAKVMDALLTLETDAHYIFNNPPGECPQDVRDVIEWYASSVRQLLAAKGAK